MKCSTCTNSTFYWQGEVLMNSGDPHALVRVRCHHCGRTYEAAMPWDKFKVTAEGKEPAKKHPHAIPEEDRVPPEEVKKFRENFKKEFGGDDANRRTN